MKYLFELLKQGGKIVSSNDCTVVEIIVASSCGRWYVDEQGFAFIYFPENYGKQMDSKLSGKVVNMGLYESSRV